MLFKSQNQPATTALKLAQKTTRGATLIGPDMIVHGNLKSPGELQIEGTVIGDIETGCQLEGHSRRLIPEPDAGPLAPFTAASPPALFNVNSFVPAPDAEAVWE